MAGGRLRDEQEMRDVLLRGYRARDACVLVAVRRNDRVCWWKKSNKMPLTSSKMGRGATVRVEVDTQAMNRLDEVSESGSGVG